MCAYTQPYLLIERTLKTFEATALTTSPRDSELPHSLCLALQLKTLAKCLDYR